jgi:hypothetical protein
MDKKELDVVCKRGKEEESCLRNFEIDQEYFRFFVVATSVGTVVEGGRR